MRRLLLFFAAILAVQTLSAAPLVRTERLPAEAIQPQIAQSTDGTVHLLYFKGKPAGGDLFYMRKPATEEKFSKPIRVNSVPGSAIAIGSIRGAHLALGRNDRVHVAWMGGEGATKIMIGHVSSTPMLYARLAEDGKSFEPERNVMTYTSRLDGGGTVAADAHGNVYVAWHGAPPSNADGESERAVYVAHSSDDGKTFGRELRASPNDKSGTCACCGMGAFADTKGALYLLYRAAEQMTNRNEILLVSENTGKSFKVANSDRWVTGTCPMSSTSFAEGNGKTYAAWETAGKINSIGLPQSSTDAPERFSPSGDKTRKHPALAVNSRGETLVAWTEGTGWDKGGSAGWQVFDSAGKPITQPESTPGVPTWGLVAAYARPDGSFVIIF
jgi:hypothetical protein